jgi:hypothetical protein
LLNEIEKVAREAVVKRIESFEGHRNVRVSLINGVSSSAIRLSAAGAILMPVKVSSRISSSKAPHKYSRDLGSQPSDEDGPYSMSKLQSWDARFRRRMERELELSNESRKPKR